MADIQRSGLVTSLNHLFGSAKYSDLTIKCGADEFKLHRAIVCLRSKFFAAACDGQFQEAQTSTIFLWEDDPPTVRRMLTYLYTLAYDDEGDTASIQHYMVDGSKVGTSNALTTMTTPLSAEELLRHAKMVNNVAMCAIANKYDIGELKELATVKFSDLLWLEAPSHGLPDIIHAVFETTSITDPGLRNVAVEFCTHYSTEIVADDYLSSLIKDHGELGLDVLREVDEQKELLQKKLVKLKGKLAQMISDASKSDSSSFSREALRYTVGLQRKLKMAHDSILIED